MRGTAAVWAAGCVLWFCTAGQAFAADGWTEVFEHVRIHEEDGLVEFDGTVPIDPANEDNRVVYLEQMVCPQQTKEHESLVVSRCSAQDVHAALLLVGAKPGAPGGFRREGGRLVSFEPTGDAIEVVFHYTDADGNDASDFPWEWVADRSTGGVMAPAEWVFAGSFFGPNGMGVAQYRADGEGTIVGLTTFGTETVGMRQVRSHRKGVAEEVWVADPERTPPVDTQVRVRLRVLKGAAE